MDDGLQSCLSERAILRALAAIVKHRAADLSSTAVRLPLVPYHLRRVQFPEINGGGKGGGADGIDQFNLSILLEGLVVQVASSKPESSFAAKVVRRNQKKRSRIHIPERDLRILASRSQCFKKGILEDVSLELGCKVFLSSGRWITPPSVQLLVGPGFCSRVPGALVILDRLDVTSGAQSPT